jgi:hypothetical protein
VRSTEPHRPHPEIHPLDALFSEKRLHDLQTICLVLEFRAGKLRNQSAPAQDQKPVGQAAYLAQTAG